MTTNLALQTRETDMSIDTWKMLREQAQMLVSTQFLPQSIKTAEQAIAIILQGRELGIPTMAALSTINIIQNKPTISPQLMLALINRSGQVEDIQITNGETEAVCVMKRKGRAAHTEKFGTREAAAMGLTGKDNYKKQAATMFRWRAVAACARIVFPDVILGIYTPEEMGAEVNDAGEIVQQPAEVRQIKAAPTAQEISLRQQLGELCDRGGIQNGKKLASLEKFDKFSTLEEKENYVGIVRQKIEEAETKAAESEPVTIEGEIVDGLPLEERKRGALKLIGQITGGDDVAIESILKGRDIDAMDEAQLAELMEDLAVI